MGLLSLFTKFRAQLESFLYFVRAIFAAFSISGEVCPFLIKQHSFVK
ncbi:RAxF-45 family protein [Sporolactobacillus putidus]